jgi:hypothetical protein
MTGAQPTMTGPQPTMTDPQPTMTGSQSVTVGAAPRRRRPRLATLVGVVLLALGLVAVAAAAALAATGLGRATKLRARFSTAHTNSASGLVLRTRGRPPPAGVTEAPAVRQTVILPRGTRLRLAALPQCLASDALIEAQGAEVACPARSRVGGGGADGVLSGAPVHFDIGIYAVRGHLVFAAERGGLPLKQSFVGIAEGARLVLTVPTLGGTIAPTGFDASIPARPGGKVWLLTPAQCPPSGHWKALGRFQGVSSADPGAPAVTPSQTLVDRMPCG